VGHGPAGGLRVASGSTGNATAAGASAAVAAAARLAPGRSAPTAAPKRNRARVWVEAPRSRSRSLPVSGCRVSPRRQGCRRARGGWRRVRGARRSCF